jgi:PBSX family phage terminase large subunit
VKIKKISPKQLKVLTWWMGGSGKNFDAIICDGAIRSGKTLFMGMSFIMWAMNGFSGQKFGMCGKTIVSLKRNVIDVVLPILRELGYRCEEKVSRNLLIVSADGRVNEFYFFGGKDEGSAALVQGVTFAGVLFDEVALQPRSFVEQALARCSVEGSRFWFNCNPESPAHWFYREWITRREARRALYLHFTMEDNPSLSDKMRDRYRRMYTGAFYDRFILGKWVQAQGRVYDFFDESYIRDAPEGTAEKYYVSCDYGTANPTSFGLWGLYDGVWYRVKEYYFDSRREGYQKTDEDYAEELRKFIGERNVQAVIVDPSAASFIETLRRKDIRVLKAKNDVVTGIRLTADYLKSKKIVICRECEDAIREFSLYVWDESAGSDTPKKTNDHSMDEIRYFVSTVLSAQDEDFAVISARR